MKIEDVEEGMHVTVNDDISTTDRRFSSCGEMYELRGKMCRIEGIMEGDKAVSMNGFTWDVGDITEVEVHVEPHVVHFNEQELI